MALRARSLHKISHVILFTILHVGKMDAPTTHVFRSVKWYSWVFTLFVYMYVNNESIYVG